MALAIIAEGNDACKIAYCRVCLDAFTKITGRGRPRKRCKSCQVAEKPTKPRAYNFKPHSRIKAQHDCQYCGKIFRPFNRKRAKYCSHECAFEQQRIDRKAARELRAASKPGPHCKIHLCECRVCTAPFYSKSALSTVCTDACSKKDANIESRLYSARLKLIKPVACEECSSVFVAQYGDKRRKYCSKKCAVRVVRRIRKPQERARMRSATVERVDPFKVFDRDGWRCQICRKPTPQRLRGTIEHNAPELDHIVPLARGGEHSYGNTQCACRKCNGRKSNSVYGQLHLFAVQ